MRETHVKSFSSCCCCIIVLFFYFYFWWYLPFSFFSRFLSSPPHNPPLSKADFPFPPPLPLQLPPFLLPLLLSLRFFFFLYGDSIGALQITEASFFFVLSVCKAARSFFFFISWIMSAGYIPSLKRPYVNIYVYICSARRCFHFPLSKRKSSIAAGCVHRAHAKERGKKYKKKLCHGRAGRNCSI